MKINGLLEFERHISKTLGCWIWKGSHGGSNGAYGRFNLGYGLTLYAHRLAWEFYHGQIPEELQVLHKCDNPTCVNPDHLFLGTEKDNHRDKAAKGRHHNQRKTHCPMNHEYTPRNTYVTKVGNRRQCRVCLYEQKIASRMRKRCL